MEQRQIKQYFVDKKKNGGKQVQLEFQTEIIICDFVIIKV